MPAETPFSLLLNLVFYGVQLSRDARCVLGVWWRWLGVIGVWWVSGLV